MALPEPRNWQNWHTHNTTASTCTLAVQSNAHPQPLLQTEHGNMRRTLTLVLALTRTSNAISAPRTKAALQLRGGGLDDLDVVQVGAAALGAAGLNQWISPKASFEIYGVTRPTRRR